jgi:hypothetical protein
VPSALPSLGLARERRAQGRLAEDLSLDASQAYHGNPERTRLISKMGKVINGAWKDSLFGTPSIPTTAESAERSWNDGLSIIQNQLPQARSAFLESILSGSKKDQDEAQAHYQRLRNRAHDLMDATIGYTMAADDLGKSDLTLEDLHNGQDDRMREMEAMRLESGMLASPPIDPIDLGTGGLAAGLKSAAARQVGREAGKQAGRQVGKTVVQEWGDDMAEEGVRAMKMPKTDPHLKGSGLLGYTSLNGDVYLRPGLPRSVQADTLRHEGVHSFLSPKDGSPLAKIRQELLGWGVENSHLLNYLEEALAEGVASKSVIKGLRYPLTHDYNIKLNRVLTEDGALGAVNGGAWYMATKEK